MIDNIKLEVLTKPTEIVLSDVNVRIILSEYLKTKGYNVNPTDIKMYTSTYRDWYSGKYYGSFQYAKAFVKKGD